MAANRLLISYDPEADLLEVSFGGNEALTEPTGDDRVMTQVDDKGNVIGFSVLGLKSSKAAIEVDVPMKHDTGRRGGIRAGRMPKSAA